MVTAEKLMNRTLKFGVHIALFVKNSTLTQ